MLEYYHKILLLIISLIVNIVLLKNKTLNINLINNWRIIKFFNCNISCLDCKYLNQSLMKFRCIEIQLMQRLSTVPTTRKLQR